MSRTIRTVEQYVRGSDWLLHEAFCLYAERDIWKPYEKHHSTVKDACELCGVSGSRTSFSGTRRTAMLPEGNGFTRARESAITVEIFMYRMMRA